METSSEEIQLPKDSEEETDKKPKGIVPDQNEAEVVAEKKQTNMASKKRKSDEGLASPTDRKIKEEPVVSVEPKGTPVFSKIPDPLNVLMSMTRNLLPILF